MDSHLFFTDSHFASNTPIIRSCGGTCQSEDNLATERGWTAHMDFNAHLGIGTHFDTVQNFLFPTASR